MSSAVDNRVRRVRIVGGGLVGALNACIFGKRGWDVSVYESRQDARKLPATGYNGRSISLSVSERARAALRAVGLEQKVLELCNEQYGRFCHALPPYQHFYLSYSPNGDQCILSTSRHLLNQVMLTEAERYPNVQLFFQHKLRHYKPDTEQLIFERLTDQETVCVCVKGDLVCGCDGAYSALRRSLMTVPKFDFSQQYINHGYIELCIPPTKDQKVLNLYCIFNRYCMFQLKPNVFHLWPREEFCMIALANKDGSFTATLFAPWNIFEQLKAYAELNKKKLLEFFDQHFPDALPLIGSEEIVGTFTQIEPNPLVSLKCQPHHFGNNILLMGDAAHAMVPFYGQGMNCGFEDCLVLSETLDKHQDDFAVAVPEYSRQRCPDTHAMNDLAMQNYMEMLNRAGWLSTAFCALVGLWAFKGPRIFPQIIHRLACAIVPQMGER